VAVRGGRIRFALPLPPLWPTVEYPSLDECAGSWGRMGPGPSPISQAALERVVSSNGGDGFLPLPLAPLQACLRLAWFYTGDDDECRLARGAEFNHSEEVVASWMDQAMEVKDVAATLLPEENQALCEDPGRYAIMEGLPAINVRELVSGRVLQGGRRASGHGGGIQVPSSSGVFSGRAALTCRSCHVSCR
jgi:hypothetical protein